MDKNELLTPEGIGATVSFSMLIRVLPAELM
jgi:hypothetical protein